ncbi:carbohydrate ABC transporter permease [Paenibacillus lemnae]|uniref:Carbohydrate ABC transporter permease n=1 Tax=Paenibacillus lemnae TaxID=1330551 RepID=A0A848M2Z5_PAELE|nr:carbohydrate ABC transporter permease [Paenibacillus lemnae]NMO94621.1 carbohydrate ABC transporter permease [Paenibacillus lemnae]
MNVTNSLKRLRVRRSFKLFRMDRTQITLMILLTAGGVFMILPLVYIFNHALKPYSELFLFPPRIFVQEPTLSNFTEFFVVLRDSTIPITRFLFNSLIVTGIGTFMVIIVSSLCAYPLAKHRFPGHKIAFSIIILSLMFVPEAMQIPRYVVVARLGIMDTYWGHILPHIAAPVSVFLMKQFMDQVPTELLEAGKLDGAREWTVFYRIVMPICMPAVATSAILTFQSIWNDASTSVLFMQNDAMKTFPYFLSTITNNLANQVARQGAAAAAALIMFLPTLIVFLVFQRKVISTMAHSGIK